MQGDGECDEEPDGVESSGPPGFSSSFQDGFFEQSAILRLRRIADALDIPTATLLSGCPDGCARKVDAADQTSADTLLRYLDLIDDPQARRLFIDLIRTVRASD